MSMPVTTARFQNDTWCTPVAYSFQTAGAGFQKRSTERYSYCWCAGVSCRRLVSTTLVISGDSPRAIAASTICPPPCRGQKVGYTDNSLIDRPSGFGFMRDDEAPRP